MIKKETREKGFDALGLDIKIMPIKMAVTFAVGIIKMIILLIMSLITGFFRVCIPPGPLSMLSCPEATIFRDNLYHLLEFFEKTE